jgi:hypothetical protein
LNQSNFAQGRIFIESSSILKTEREAILILPGFGSKIFGTKKIAKFFKHKGYDIYIPKYISRKSVEKSVENVDRFISKHGLKDYKKLHIFSYIFGTWTINLWINKNGKCNISTIVFDRSPLQERAPAALDRAFVVGLFSLLIYFIPSLNSFSDYIFYVVVILLITSTLVRINKTINLSK